MRTYLQLKRLLRQCRGGISIGDAPQPQRAVGAGGGERARIRSPRRPCGAIGMRCHRARARSRRSVPQAQLSIRCSRCEHEARLAAITRCCARCCDESSHAGGVPFESRQTRASRQSALRGFQLGMRLLLGACQSHACPKHDPRSNAPHESAPARALCGTPPQLRPAFPAPSAQCRRAAAAPPAAGAAAPRCARQSATPPPAPAQAAPPRGGTAALHLPAPRSAPRSTQRTRLRRLQRRMRLRRATQPRQTRLPGRLQRLRRAPHPPPAHFPQPARQTHQFLRPRLAACSGCARRGAGRCEHADRHAHVVGATRCGSLQQRTPGASPSRGGCRAPGLTAPLGARAEPGGARTRGVASARRAETLRRARSLAAAARACRNCAVSPPLSGCAVFKTLRTGRARPRRASGLHSCRRSCGRARRVRAAPHRLYASLRLLRVASSRDRPSRR